MTHNLFTDTTPMPFGRYKGKAMVNVPAIYLLWLWDSGCDHEGVRNYIKANYTLLQNEAKRAKR